MIVDLNTDTLYGHKKRIRAQGVTKLIFMFKESKTPLS